MILYHVSFDAPDPDGRRQFVPGIPQMYANGEDRTIPRICFAKSIGQAIRSCSCAPVIRVFDFFKIKPTLYIYAIRTSQLRDDEWLDSADVANYVPDAKDNGECWLLTPVELAAEPFVVEQASFARAWFRVEEQDSGQEPLGEIVNSAEVIPQKDVVSNEQKLAEACEKDRTEIAELCSNVGGLKIVCSVLNEFFLENGNK